MEPKDYVRELTPTAVRVDGGMYFFKFGKHSWWHSEAELARNARRPASLGEVWSEYTRGARRFYVIDFDL